MVIQQIYKMFYRLEIPFLRKLQFFFVLATRLAKSSDVKRNLDGTSVRVCLANDHLL